MAWEPIRRISPPAIEGIDERNPRRLQVNIILSAPPPPEWARHFTSWYHQPNVDMPEDEPWAWPHIEGVLIRFGPQDGDLERWVQSIDKGISEANSYYERDVLPKKEAEQKAREDAEDEQARRLEEARRRARRLTPEEDR
jgi:hypothetical protein